MSDAALGVLKGCLLALVYLFLLRVVLLVASELRGTPGLGRATAPAPSSAAVPRPEAAPRQSKRERRAATPVGAAWRLVIVEPAGARGTAFPVAGEVTIGRGGGCAISLPTDTFVSTVHARVYTVDGDLWIEDLGSTNGTLVNDQPLQQPAQLRHGDTVRVGSTMLEVGP